MAIPKSDRKKFQLRQQDVFRFDISVDDTLPMRSRQASRSGAQLDGDLRLQRPMLKKR